MLLDNGGDCPNDCSMKRLFAPLVLLLALAPVFAADKPNILFLFNDDQRADTIAALGNPIIRTPNLDRLCRQGMAFTQAHMQGGFARATRIPSRAMLLSGHALLMLYRPVTGSVPTRRTHPIRRVV